MGLCACADPVNEHPFPCIEDGSWTRRSEQLGWPSIDLYCRAWAPGTAFMKVPLLSSRQMTHPPANKCHDIVCFRCDLSLN
jgi:hypothetical protein